MKRIVTIFFLVLVCGVADYSAHASSIHLLIDGKVIPFQGVLYENGEAVNGAVNITFPISDLSSL